MIRKVLFITDELRVGGGETYFYKIENNIDRSKIDLFTCAEMGECYDKVKFKEKFTACGKGFKKKFKTIKHVIAKEEIQIVHANSLNLCIIAVLIRAFTRRKFKVIYTKHNLTTLEKINDRLFADFININVDIMITVCESDKIKMVDKGVKEHKIVAIPNGIDISQFDFNPRYMLDNKALNIGILARLSEEKNHVFFLKIIEELQNNTDVNFNAYIAGDGVLREELEEIIKDKGLRVKILGNVEEPEGFLKDMDIKMLVSTREVFPMTILEAMCVGALVVTVDVGGVKDCVINGETGYLVSEYDTERFIDIIQNIYNNKSSNKEIILKARKLVECTFSMKKMIQELVNLYMED